LFCVNLDQQFNKEFFDYLAEKSVRIKRELHPILKTFLFVEGNFVPFSFYGQKHILFLQNTIGMELLTGSIPITIHLKNGMVRLW